MWHCRIVTVTIFYACWLALASFPLCAEEKFEVESSAGQGVNAYTHPGVVSFRAGRWIGNDNLYNLGSDIRVVCEIIKPAGTSLSITAEQLRTKAEAALKGASINPEPSTATSTTLLPFLHLQVLVYPIEGGFAASIQLRLFENVTLGRVQTEAGAQWQAITWEKESLIVAKAGDFNDSLNKSADEMLDAFTKRYAFYQKLKTYMK